MLVFVALTPLARRLPAGSVGESTDLALWIAIVIGIIGASISGSAIPTVTSLRLSGVLFCPRLTD